MLNLSRTRLKTLIWAQLQADEAIWHRWLQEHPDCDQIMNQLVTDAMELTIEAHNSRSATPPSFWKSLGDYEIETTVVDQILAATDLWAEISEEFPRPNRIRTKQDVIHDLLGELPTSPRFDRIVVESPRGD